MLSDPRPYFAELPDPRRETRNKLHKLNDILRGCWKTPSSEPSDQEMDHRDLDHGLAVARMDFIISRMTAVI